MQDIFAKASSHSGSIRCRIGRVLWRSEGSCGGMGGDWLLLGFEGVEVFVRGDGALGDCCAISI